MCPVIGVVRSSTHYMKPKMDTTRSSVLFVDYSTLNPPPSAEEIEEGVKIGAHRGETALTSTGRYMPLKIAI